MTDNVHPLGIFFISFSPNNFWLNEIGMKSPIKEEQLSESVKLLKYEMLLKVIDSNDMSQCIIFCRTRLDCDNVEKVLNHASGIQSIISFYELTLI